MLYVNLIQRTTTPFDNINKYIFGTNYPLE